MTVTTATITHDRHSNFFSKKNNGSKLPSFRNAFLHSKYVVIHSFKFEMIQAQN